MGPHELLQVLNNVSGRLHECGEENFLEEEREAWRVACGAVETLKLIVAARINQSIP